MRTGLYLDGGEDGPEDEADDEHEDDEDADRLVHRLLQSGQDLRGNETQRISTSSNAQYLWKQ